MRVGLLALAALAILGVPPWATATDVTIRQRVTSSMPGAKPHEEMQYITATKHVSDSAERRTIVDLEAKTLTSVDKEKKTYWVMTAEDLRRQREALEQQLARMPPEARRMMESMDSPVTLKPTGRTERIAGYEATEYAIEGGATTGSVWMTTAIDVPMDEKEWERFAGGAGARQGPGAKLAEAMAALKGLPLRSTMTTAMGPSRYSATTEALEVKEARPPAEVLGVPADFRKVDSPVSRAHAGPRE